MRTLLGLNGLNTLEETISSEVRGNEWRGIESSLQLNNFHNSNLLILGGHGG